MPSWWCMVAGRCNQIRREKPKGRHNPRTKNFQKLPRTICGIVQERWFDPTLNAWISSCGPVWAAIPPSHRADLGPNGTPPSEPPRFPGSPTSWGPFHKYQIPLTSLISNVYVKKDPGVTWVGGLSLGGRMRHFDLQSRLEAVSEYLVASRSWKLTTPLSAKTWQRRWWVTSGVWFASCSPTSGAAASGRFLELEPMRLRLCVLCPQVLLHFSFTDVAASIIFILFACVSSLFLPSRCRRALETVVPILASGLPLTGFWLHLWNSVCLSGKWEWKCLPHRVVLRIKEVNHFAQCLKHPGGS